MKVYQQVLIGILIFVVAGFGLNRLEDFWENRKSVDLDEPEINEMKPSKG